MKQCCGRFVAIIIVVISSVAHAEDGPAQFFRGLNLNGPSVTIDGRVWEGKESPNYTSKDKAFDTQTVKSVAFH